MHVRDRFVSKRDGWLVTATWGGAGLGALALALVAGGPPAGAAVGLVALAAIGLGLWILYGTHYTFEASALRIRGGPFRWRVPFSEILRVEPSTNPISSPACSLDRLAIQYGTRQICVSPLERGQFLKRLAHVCPHLRLDGERLVPARRT